MRWWQISLRNPQCDEKYKKDGGLIDDSIKPCDGGQFCFATDIIIPVLCNKYYGICFGVYDGFGGIYVNDYEIGYISPDVATDKRSFDIICADCISFELIQEHVLKPFVEKHVQKVKSYEPVTTKQLEWSKNILDKYSTSKWKNKCH